MKTHPDRGPSSKRSLAVVLAALALGSACPAEDIHLPGRVKDVRLALHFTDLDADEIAAVGSFSLSFHDEDGLVSSGALSFDPQTRSASWAKEPDPPLAPEDELTVHVRAFDVTGAPLALGGAAGPVDLAAVGVVPAQVRVLVSRLDGFAPARVALLAPRFGATATVVAPAAVLVVGGAGEGDPAVPAGLVAMAERLDVATGERCATGEGCGLDEAPGARVEHVAVALRTDLGCRGEGRALIALGRDGAGVLGDAWLYDDDARARGDAAFTRLASLSLTPRANATAALLPGCRVLLAGGVDGAGAATDLVEILELGGDAPSSSPSSLRLSAPASGAAAVTFENGIGEVVVLGGEDAGIAVGAATSFSVVAGELTSCALGDAGCNGLGQSLRCARQRPSAALVVPGEHAVALVLGDADGSCALSGTAAEVLQARDDAPFLSFSRLAEGPLSPRTAGFTTTPMAGGALVAGGLDATGAAVTSAERFSFAYSDAGDELPAFDAVDGLLEARAFHAAAPLSWSIAVVGGWDGAGPLGSVEVFVPAAAVP